MPHSGDRLLTVCHMHHGRQSPSQQPQPFNNHFATLSCARLLCQPTDLPYRSVGFFLSEAPRASGPLACRCGFPVTGSCPDLLLGHLASVRSSHDSGFPVTGRSSPSVPQLLVVSVVRFSPGSLPLYPTPEHLTLINTLSHCGSGDFAYLCHTNNKRTRV